MFILSEKLRGKAKRTFCDILRYKMYFMCNAMFYSYVYTPTYLLYICSRVVKKNILYEEEMYEILFEI